MPACRVAGLQDWPLVIVDEADGGPFGLAPFAIETCEIELFHADNGESQ